MNLFRSEDHVRKWKFFASGTEQGIVPLANVAALFSGDFMRKRLEPDYVSRFPGYWAQVIGALRELAKEHPFWTPPGSG
jgi:hypothetical protein